MEGLEGGFVTLFVGAFLIALFTDVAPPGAKDRAAAYAVAAASGLGLLVSGALRNSGVLMAGGLALVAIGLCAQLLPRATARQ